MNASASADGAAPDLVFGWLNARSIARGVPAPVADHGGWRVDTRSAVEECRYVFAAPDAAIAALARSITAPRIFLKLCAQDETLAALLPPYWCMAAPSWLMTTDRDDATFSLPIAYDARVEETNGAIRASITAPDGTIAASGYAAEADGFFVYDRIVTQPEHRRLGLGRAVMRLLARRRKDGAARQVLVATDQGRALYATLGWQVETGYATAVIPDPAS